MRNLRPDDVLPWPAEALGWNQKTLHLETAWVAERDGQIVGLILGADVHHSLLLLRVLGNGGSWIRPLWKHVKMASLAQGIVSFWTFFDNDRRKKCAMPQSRD
jgi:hypothetical protein